MSAPRLLIRKRMLNIQGRVRPCCFVQALVGPDIQAVLEKHFQAEALFRRAAYSVSWPEGAAKIPPALAPALAAFLKNDACPEITVKTMLAGQTQQGANVWEMMSFEVIAKVAFDNLVHLISTIADIDRDVFYHGLAPAADIVNFAVDTSAEGAVLGADALAVA